jgi:hypothetical protein
VLALIAGLPQGGVLHRSIDEHAWWTPEMEMMALTVEVIDTARVWAAMPHWPKNEPKPEPLRIPRPREQDAEPEKPKGATPEEIAAFLRR